jgi:hypothetical protein
MKNKIETLAKLIEAQTIERLKASGLDCPLNVQMAATHISDGKKYIAIDSGMGGQRSAKLMIDANGVIFGVKGWRVINKIRNYGTLDTINEYFWGAYYPQRLKAAA